MEQVKKAPQLGEVSAALDTVREFRSAVEAKAGEFVRQHGGILNNLGAKDKDMPHGTGTALALTRTSISGLDNNENLEGGYVRLDYVVPTRMSADLPSIPGCNLISRGQPYWTLEIPLAMLVNGDSQSAERSEAEPGGTAKELSGSVGSEILGVYQTC